MPRKKRRRKKRVGSAIPRLRQMVLDGEPWQGPVPGVSSSPFLTHLLTGHDFFGDAFGHNAEGLRHTWAALRDDVLRTARDLGVEALPWAHRCFDLEEKAEIKTETIGAVTYWFDEHAVDRVLTFFRAFLTHVEGPLAGRPFEPLPWQVNDLFRPLFGWKRPDGSRRFRDVYVEIPKKQGKSAITSGLCLYLVAADGEPLPRVFGLAADRDNAKIVFDPSKQMVLASPQLSRRLRPLARQIDAIQTGGEYRVMSAESKTKHGYNSSATIFDELHAQPDSKLWNVFDGAGAARRQPIRLSITTAGSDQQSICFEQRDRALMAMRDPEWEPDLLGVIYSAAETDALGRQKTPDDWATIEAARRANPSFGVTVDEDFYQAKIRQALQRPSYRNIYLQLHLNIWTDAPEIWIPSERWDACDLDVEVEPGRVGYGGLDLSSNTDLTAFSLFFPARRGRPEPAILLSYFWLPGDRIRERGHKDRANYEKWVDEGFIDLCKGTEISHPQIFEKICALKEEYRFKYVGYDRWGMEWIKGQLIHEGFEMHRVSMQGFSDLSPPSKELERLILGRLVSHGKNPVLRWMNGNVQLEKNANGDIRPSKSKSKKKIDGIISTVCAMSAGITHTDHDKPPFNPRSRTAPSSRRREVMDW